jgi:kynureninase
VSPSASGIAVRHPDLLAYRAEFPLLAATTYLNTCSLGALSIRSRHSLDRFLGQWDGLGARAWYRHWLEELNALREDFGAIIGRPGAEIALAPNVSTALASFASALDPIHRGDAAALGRLREAGLPVEGFPRERVITTALDFPTVGHQWLARAQLGVELVVLQSPDGLTVPLEAFEAAIDDRTAVVATAHVYYATGAVPDLAALATIAHERGALVLVDAYQATGLIPTNLGAGLPESQPDAYVSGTLKWVFGGPVRAFFWVRPELRAALRPTTTGWFSSARQFDFDVAALEFAPDGRQFELGTPSVPSAFIARGGLELVREIGVRRLYERTLDLGDVAIGAAEAAGLRVRAVRDRDRRGGIVAIEVADPKPIVEELARRNVITDYRPGIIRLSPGFYNAEDEVVAAVDMLADLVASRDRA